MDFCDWMVTEEHPNGIIVTDELELIRQHPEYIDLTAEPPTKQHKTADLTRHSDIIGTDYGSKGDTQAGMHSAQRSPAFPSRSPSRSPIREAVNNDDDDEVDDDLEADFLSAMDEKKPADSVHVNTRAYLEDPAYIQLIASRDRWQKAVRDADRDVNEYTAKVNANSNIVVKVQFYIWFKGEMQGIDDLLNRIDLNK